MKNDKKKKLAMKIDKNLVMKAAARRKPKIENG